MIIYFSVDGQKKKKKTAVDYSWSKGKLILDFFQVKNFNIPEKKKIL